MGKHHKEVDTTNRVDMSDIDSWFTDFQACVLKQINKGYTGQILMGVKNGRIEYIKNIEMIGASTLDNPVSLE